MKFYSSIADYYDYIFPYNPMHKTFILNSVATPDNKSLLDIGSGTGNLSLKLAESFNSVSAIDLDQEMVTIAKSKKKDLQNINFKCMNMMDIDNVFGDDCFDSIISFGNTLVHLPGTEMISQFFRNTRKALKPSGKFLIQIINYDRILKERVNVLSTIENKYIKFERKYNYIQKNNIIDFITELTVKKTGEIFNNKVNLYPLLKSEFRLLLEQNGFENINFYGNFKKEILSDDNIPLIVEAY
jgi:glycine/sarcosine N-methyltransferase